MYLITHPSYIKAWASKKMSLEEIQVALKLSLEETKKTLSTLEKLGSVVKLKDEPETVNIDLNNDGEFNKKDLTVASKTLNKGKKLKKQKNVANKN